MAVSAPCSQLHACSDWAARQQALCVLQALVTSLRKPAAQHLQPIVQAAWQLLTAAAERYTPIVVLGEGAPAELADGVPFAALAEQAVELFRTLMGGPLGSKQLKQLCGELLYYCIAFLQACVCSMLQLAVVGLLASRTSEANCMCTLCRESAFDAKAPHASS